MWDAKEYDEPRSSAARARPSRAARATFSVDPIMDTSDPQQMHGYTYGNNNPVIHADSGGKFFASFVKRTRPRVRRRRSGTRIESAGTEFLAG